MQDLAEPVGQPNYIPVAIKRARYPEIFETYHDPSELAPSPRPPDHVQAALEDVFGSVALGKDPVVKLAMHPWFRRWGLFERVGGLGEGAWACFWLCDGEVVSGVLPNDLNFSDCRFEELRGCIGDFRVPDKSDFERIIQKSDKTRSAASREQALTANTQEAERDGTRMWQDKTRDLLDYNFLAITAAANREYGSGWKPWSVPTVEPHKNPERWVEFKRNGYTTKVKRGSLAHESMQAEHEQSLRATERELESERLRRLARAAVYGGAKAGTKTL